MKARIYRKRVAKKLKEQETANGAMLVVPVAAAAMTAERTASETGDVATVPPDMVPSAASVVAAIVAELPELLAVAVVETESGTALATHSGTAGLNPATAATHNAQVIKQKMKAMAALNLDQERLEDILITLSNQLHLLMLNQDGSRFLYLVVSAHNSSLAMARAVLRAHVHELD